ncbi:MAG: autotransporter-associated beta strand repeat-containing protein [Kiritimatiellae bacterium]|nr:autotransporter-associated beta strand repeat-containing protein [Kiritimatiellia bacterium]
MATFTTAITASRTVTVDASPWTINGLSFNNTGPYGWTLAGGTLLLAGTTPTVTVAASGTPKIASPLSGSAGLTKAGTGTLTLSGANTFSGAMTISTGKLQIGDGTSATATAGTGPLVIGANTLYLNLNGPAVLANSSVTSASPSLIQNIGAGKVTISNDIIVTGTTIDGGTAGIVLANTLPAGVGRDFQVKGDITFGSAGSRTITSAASGTTMHIVNSGMFWWIGAGGSTGPQYAPTLDIASGVTVFLSDNQGAGTICYSNLTGAGNFTYSGDNKTLGYVLGSSTLGGTFTVKRPVSFGNGNAGGMAGNTRIDTTSTGIVIFNSTTDNTYSGTMSGAGALIKTNANTLTLTGTLSYTGPTTISGGTLALDGGAVLGTGAYAGTILNNGEFRFGSGAAQTLSGAISGTGALVINGAGTVTLAGYNTYSGPTRVNAGKLMGATGGACANSPVIIAGGTTNGISIFLYGQSWTCASLTYTGPAALDFELGSFPVNAALAPLQVNGDLNVTGTVSVAVKDGFWSAAGTYPLLSYTGSLNGPGSFTLAALPAGLEATLVTDTENKRLALNVTAVPSAAGTVSLWTRLTGSNGSGDWGTPENWSDVIPNAVDAVADFSTLNIGSASYVNNDTPRTVGGLRFADATPSHDWNVTNATLTLATSLGMPVVTVSNRTATFLSGLVASQGFIKDGAGTLNLSGFGANSFGGQILLKSGTLAVYKGASLQNSSGPIIVSPGATLNIDGGYDGILVTNTLYLGGTGTGTYGALHLARNQYTTGPIRLTDDTLITSTDDPFLQGPITAVGEGKNLEFKTLGVHAPRVYDGMNLGTGTLTASAVPGSATAYGFSLSLRVANTYSGGTVLTNYAVVFILSTGSLGSGGVTIGPNAGLSLQSQSITLPWLKGTGGFITDMTVSSFSTTTLTVNQAIDTVFAGTISNGASRVIALVKSGAGSLTLSGVNTYTGATTVAGGTLGVGTSLASPSVTVASGSGLSVSATGVVSSASLTGTLTFQDSSRLLVDIRSSLADTVSVSGNVAVGNNVELRVSDDPTSSGTWKIIESTSGTLSGDFVLVGGSNRITLTKVGNAVWLTIPPKGTVLQIY